MLRSIISILLLLWPFLAMSQQDDADSVAVRPVTDTVRQIRLGIDISKPILNALQNDTLVSNKRSYEFELDYYWKNELYLVLEGGWGGIDVNYADLKYSSRNSFFKAGFNKSMLGRIAASDWDMAFIGLRYAAGFIRRGDATYITTDNIWGTTSGVIPAKNLTGHWAEALGGVKLELYRGIFIGWSARAKFLLNKKEFAELPPAYVAGYGKGDKNTIFDFNFYLSYAFRWKKYPRVFPN